MAAKMRPFDDRACCPKCGGVWIGTRYCSEAVPVQKCWPSMRGEHIHRTCQRCGYEWLESVLEGNKEAPPGGRSLWPVHDLKCWPGPFTATRLGLKRFEWRKDDRGYAVGDTLRLREWDPATQTYSGAECWRRVTWLVRGRAFDIPDGYCIMSVEPCAAQEVPPT